LATSPGLVVTTLQAEAGEVDQGEASRRIAKALAGPGTQVEPPHQGQVLVRSARAGLVRIDPSRVDKVNRSGGLLLATSLDGRVVHDDEVIAVVKASRLWVTEAEVSTILGIASDEPVIRVAAFVSKHAAFLAGERVRPANIEQAIPNLEQSLAPFGASLAATEHLRDTPEAIMAAYRRQIRSGAEVIFVAGSIVLDPGDPYMVAVEEAGGEMLCQGAPIDPGTMFWVGKIGRTILLGLASCELFGRLSVLDLILPYALAREPITPALFAQLGYGGLLEHTFAARR